MSCRISDASIRYSTAGPYKGTHYFAHSTGGVDEICSAAGRPRISRGVREQSSTADAAEGRFLYAGGGKLAFQPIRLHTEMPHQFGAASALLIA